MHPFRALPSEPSLQSQTYWAKQAGPEKKPNLQAASFLIIMKLHWVMINVGCVVAFLIQLGSVFIDGYIAPTEIQSVTENKNLRDTEFPLVFKICVNPGFNTSAIHEAGYSAHNQYFKGRSKYNKSVYGWGGHTNTSGVVGSVEHILNSISLHTVNSVFESIILSTLTYGHVNVTENIYIGRVNYPNNCFTLDITNNTDLGIKQLTFHFRTLANFSVGVYAQGASLSTHRDIRVHNLYSTGDIMHLNANGTKVQYVLDISQLVFEEENLSMKCRKYPNVDYLHYR